MLYSCVLAVLVYLGATTPTVTAESEFWGALKIKITKTTVNIGKGKGNRQFLPTPFPAPSVTIKSFLFLNFYIGCANKCFPNQLNTAQ